MNYLRKLALLALMVLPVWGQTSNFPTSTDGDSQLKVAVNNCQTALTANMTSTQTTMSVLSSTCFVQDMLLSIGASGGPQEIVAVTDADPLTITRGYDSSTAVAHTRGEVVSAYNVAWHHNSLRTSIEAIETYLLTGVASVDASITTTSLGSHAVCALHTDTGCGNTTDATSDNCTAGTLTAACTFPTSITIPADYLSGVGTLSITLGSLATATVPTVNIEIYLDSTLIYSGAANTSRSGSASFVAVCSVTSLNPGATSPLVVGCGGNGTLGTQPTSLGGNASLSDTAPAISIDTTASHVLKLQIIYSANTTGNKAWLYALRYTK